MGRSAKRSRAKLPPPDTVPGWPRDPRLDEHPWGESTAFNEGHHRAVIDLARWLQLVEEALRRYDIGAMQLASAIDVATGTMTSLLAGKRYPRLDQVAAVNAFLDIDMTPQLTVQDVESFRDRRRRQTWGQWRHKQRDRTFVDSDGEKVHVMPREPEPREYYGAAQASYNRGFKAGRQSGIEEMVDALQGPVADVLEVLELAVELHGTPEGSDAVAAAVDRLGGLSRVRARLGHGYLYFG